MIGGRGGGEGKKIFSYQHLELNLLQQGLLKYWKSVKNNVFMAKTNFE